MLTCTEVFVHFVVTASTSAMGVPSSSTENGRPNGTSSTPGLGRLMLALILSPLSLYRPYESSLTSLARSSGLPGGGRFGKAGTARRRGTDTSAWEKERYFAHHAPRMLAVASLAPTTTSAWPFAHAFWDHSQMSPAGATGVATASTAISTYSGSWTLPTRSGTSIGSGNDTFSSARPPSRRYTRISGIATVTVFWGSVPITPDPAGPLALRLGEDIVDVHTAAERDVHSDAGT
ncbi:uncharacterized protein LOC62_06G008029 [Vanrija pseudolonga]|uniref:Uncharacterized protein n=1 Tax=Vanrija pseudolonga TaxID=143232 RepID=A0AAF0YHD3_9TREE|nr:hypothetical protein LOC62_06G008029 [Vanrija pseudolonga]